MSPRIPIDRALPGTTLEASRDDGPLARLSGRVVGRVIGLTPTTLVLLGGLPLLVVLAAGGSDVSRVAIAATLAWLVAVAGAASSEPLTPPFGWSVPALLRLVDYGFLLWLAALAGGNAVPACFALLCALAFRHYDVVYRLRHQGMPPPGWISRLGGGWDGRLVLGYVLLVIGAVTAGFYILAGALALASLGESIASWVRFSRGGGRTAHEDAPDVQE